MQCVNTKRKMVDNMSYATYYIKEEFSGNCILQVYFFYVGNKAVLTNGFTKKSNKTPKAQIEICHRYKSDYEWRNSND